jgi:hypothetical protein
MIDTLEKTITRQLEILELMQNYALDINKISPNFCNNFSSLVNDVKTLIEARNSLIDTIKK